MAKILIAVPTMGTIKTHTAMSLFNLRGDEVSISCTESSLVFDARNRLSKTALDIEADYVLWVDSDMIIEPDTLEKLIADDKDIVTAIAFRRRPPYTPCIYSRLRFDLGGRHETEVFDDYPKDSLFEIDACGFGCVLIKTSVIKAVVERYKSPFDPYPGFGEDLSFCIKAKNCGFQIFCDSRVKCGHIAEVQISEDTFERYRQNGNDERTS